MGPEEFKLVATFMLMALAIVAGAGVTIAGMRAKSRRLTAQAPEHTRTVELLTQENGKLIGQVGRLEERIAVLERIVTDRSHHLAGEIDALR